MTTTGTNEIGVEKKKGIIKTFLEMIGVG